MMAMNITWSYRDRADRLAAGLTQITGGGTRQPAHAQIRKLQIASTSRAHAPVLSAELQSLSWPIIVVIVKVPACISHVPLLVGNRLLHDARRPTKQETPMLMSTDRILVSHVGSLPRPPTLSELLIRQEAGETIDAAELARQVEIATTHVIDKQVEAVSTWGMTGNSRASDFRPMFPAACAALVASPGVRRHGIKSTSQAMPGRRNCVFRTPRGWRTRPQRCPMSGM
jgi:hypothetical protein